AGKVKVTSVALGSMQEQSGNSRKAEVYIKGETTGETLGCKNFSRALTAFFVVDNDNVMQRCLGEAYDIGESCRALGGSWQFLSNRCDFCGTLGGMWNDGICVLDPLKQKCTPVTEVIAGESIGGGVGYDR